MLSYDFAETCVFGKQSPGPGHCGQVFTWHPFSRSYGVILPSSLERVVSRPLVFSTNLPVSVFGTGTFCLICSASFSWKYDSQQIFTQRIKTYHFLAQDSFSSIPQRLESFHRNPNPAYLCLLRPSLPCTEFNLGTNKK